MAAGIEGSPEKLRNLIMKPLQDHFLEARIPFLIYSSYSCTLLCTLVSTNLRSSLVYSALA